MPYISSIKHGKWQKKRHSVMCVECVTNELKIVIDEHKIKHIA